MFVKSTFFSPHATPNRSAYLLIADESKIPGRSLLSNISGLSIDPVAVITFFALILSSLWRVLLFLWSKGKWSVKFSLANRKLYPWKAATLVLVLISKFPIFLISLISFSSQELDVWLLIFC